MLRTRPWTGVCEPDVVASKVPQNNHSGPTFGFITPGFSMESSYMEDLKNQKTVKIGGWALARDNTEYSIFIRQIQSHY